MRTRGLFTQVGLGPGAFWASAGPKCAVGSNAGRGHAVTKGRGLEMCRVLEVVAFAARSRGFFSCARPGLSYRLAPRSLLPQLVAFLYARICDRSDRSDATRPSGLGAKGRFLPKEQVC